MAVERKMGTVVEWRRLSPILATFRLMPEDSTRFPEYKAGQYIALRREDCKLTKRTIGPDGRAQYAPDLDEAGLPKRGPVTHSYSISSAPCETLEHGHLEFYIVLEMTESEYPGRLTESLFRIDPSGDNQVGYMNRIAGDFTLEKRAAGSQSVVFVGTGTGLAPFAAMIKQLHADCATRPPDGVSYTLIHANRTRAELAYHDEILAIEAAQRFDFLYLSSVSRPSAGDLEDPRMAVGRANNVLRHIFGMPLKEEDDLREAQAQGGDLSVARTALEKAVRPRLPARHSQQELRTRLDPSRTVILTCGNPSSMSDIRHVADTNHIRYEKEDWKLVMPARA